MRGRNHRFPKIGTIDNYRHFWMISVWAAYLILYVIAEKVVTTDYYSVHIALDDLIPFCEWFVIPYCLWMALLACTAVYLLFWDAENFKRFTAFIGLGFIPVIIFDMIFPNGQDLRPLAFEHHNIATWLVGHIYAADSNTNVFPSMHVIGSVALYAASLYTPAFRRHKLHWVMLPSQSLSAFRPPLSSSIPARIFSMHFPTAPLSGGWYTASFSKSGGSLKSRSDLPKAPRSFARRQSLSNSI